PGVEITFKDHVNNTEQTWCYADGLNDYLCEAVNGLPTLPEKPFVGNFEGDTEAVDWALLWLPAGEAALIAYTMPVWASILAWPILGERPTWLRVLALLLAFAGLAALMGGNGLAASRDKLPGILMVLGGAFGFALGAVLAKKLPIRLPPLSAAAWQIGIGCVPIVLVGLVIEQSDWSRLDQLDWALMFYSTVIQFCVAYVTWFAALARLPASVAAIGTMAVPVIGVVASAIALREPLGAGQLAALALTLAAVALATRG
ncbi:MAG: EamA family transporter, partial [Bradyrhizobium sp.]|nr:EamA family transporter [Bradyrhizobium sp.]